MPDSMENAVAAVSAIGAAVGGSSLATIGACIGGGGLIAWGLWELLKYLFGDDGKPDKELEKKIENLQKERDAIAQECKQWQEAYETSQEKLRDSQKKRLELISDCREIISRFEGFIEDYEELRAACIASGRQMPPGFDQWVEACRAQLRQYGREIA